ncbi:hypothetical protein VaNZ11_009808 [Volvox africanus]|uniref:AAA+ ATPase domain-containing protein n=1 Tax=Volvox africanus TaxID=51714 RepID=A0ABQ5S8Y7_9CHLO|nr:hypothetical protein VaNZ11_009808 [Volvox africanus]
MNGHSLWRVDGPGAGAAWVMAPGLAGATQLLDRAAAAAAAAATGTAASAPTQITREGTPTGVIGGHTRGWLPESAASASAAGATFPSAPIAAGHPGAHAAGSTSSTGSTTNSMRSIASGHGSAGVSVIKDAWAGSGSRFASRFDNMVGSRFTSLIGAAGTRADGGAHGGNGGLRRQTRWNGGGAEARSGTTGRAAAFGFGALAAAAIAMVGTVLADQPNQPLGDAVVAAQDALKTAWGEVEEEFARVNARLPAHAPSLKGQPPTVSEVHGAVEVVVPIRDGADANAVLRELRQGLGGRGTTSYSESVYGASRTVRMEIRQAGGTLRVMMFVPPPGGSEQAQVVVSKRGSFSDEELGALKGVVVAANVTFGLDEPARSSRAQRHGLHGGLDGEPHARDMDALFEEFARSALHGFMAGPMQQIMDELQRGMGMPMPGPGENGEEGRQDGDEGDGFGSFRGSEGGFGGGVLPRSTAGTRAQGGGSTDAQGHDWGSPAAARAVEQLLGMGAQVFPPSKKDKMDWGVLAGYEEQKRTIEDCLLLPLMRPDVYAKLARATRKTFANNRPRAVLFEGPPGTGKTTSARVISSQAAVPLIYLPLEAVLSKWYGQSEQQLRAVFKAAEAMGGAIIFLDELDALGGNRESGDVSEPSRRVLSVLLREMDGFDAETRRTVVIGATNRKTDLDPALLSRFDLILTFGIPDAACRQLILRQYAKQLEDSELAQLAERTVGMSGRDLRDVCEHTERRWASKIIRGEVREEDLPPLAEYLASADERATAVQRVQQQASSLGALNRLLGNGGERPRGLSSWLAGGGQ